MISPKFLDLCVDNSYLIVHLINTALGDFISHSLNAANMTANHAENQFTP